MDPHILLSSSEPQCFFRCRQEELPPQSVVPMQQAEEEAVVVAEAVDKIYLPHHQQTQQ